MSDWVIISLWLAWWAWTYFVYQVGYDNAAKDAEEIAGKRLWFAQESACKRRVRYTNEAPWDILK